ncbi:response regulator, partial [Clostridium perfringens]
GKEAFHLISTTKPDIAIVDINMPLLNGIELIKLLKKNNLKTKVVVLSAYREFNYAQEALNFGAFAYLLKPINISSLKSTIKELYEAVKNEKEDKYIKNKYNEVLPEFKEILTKKLLLEEISQE